MLPMEEKQTSQIVSRQRVADHGEVFTAEREVKAMCDLVEHETLRIDSRFLEPACGQGAFLVEILHRKLSVVTARYSQQTEWEQNALLALSSLYGIELLPDNLRICQDNLFAIFQTTYLQLFPTTHKDELLRAARYVLEQNILLGDALTLTRPNEPQHPIVFAEWAHIGKGMFKRRDYELAYLLSEQNAAGGLFADAPIAEYPPMYYLNIGQHE